MTWEVATGPAGHFTELAAYRTDFGLPTVAAPRSCAWDEFDAVSQASLIALPRHSSPPP